MVSVRLVSKVAIVAAAVLVFALAGAQARASSIAIVASDFNQTDGVAIDTVAPDIANLPGAATWFQTGMVGSGIPTCLGFQQDQHNAPTSKALGRNGTGISIASAGSYVKPTNLHIQADIRAGITDGTDTAYGRGVGLGFYDGTQICGSTLANPMHWLHWVGAGPRRRLVLV